MEYYLVLRARGCSSTARGRVGPIVAEETTKPNTMSLDPVQGGIQGVTGGTGWGGRAGRTSGRGRGGRGRGRGGRGATAAAAAAAAGRGGAFVATSGIRSSLLTPEENRLLPDAFLACTTGWEQVDLSEEKYVIRTEEDYAEEDITGALIDSYIHAVDSMDRRLNQLGVDVNSANTVEVLISDAALVKLKEHTSQQLVQKGHTGTSTFELR
ncbi:hypothetical protein ACHAWC_008133 [Mediolabrus comicus]